jgi:hypothetical protein
MHACRIQLAVGIACTKNSSGPRAERVARTVEGLSARLSYIDGVSNLDYWTGKSVHSARDEYLYYAESRLQAIRINQWKAHFFVRDGYYGHTTKLDIAYVFNVRQDPYESYDQAPGPRATITQQKTWLYNDVMDRLARHMATLQKYPPKQKGSSLSLAN